MSSPSSLDKALNDLDKLSGTLNDTHNRLLQDGPPLQALPRLIKSIAGGISTVRGQISQEQARFQTELKNLQDLVSQCQTEGEQQKTRSEASIANLTAENARLLEDNARIQAGLSDSEKLLAKKQTVIASLHEERRRNSSTIQRNIELSKDVKDLEGQLAASQAACEELHTEHADLAESKKKLKDDWISRYNNLVDKYNHLGRDLQQVIDQLHVERNQLRRELEMNDDSQNEAVRQEEAKWKAEMKIRLEAQQASHAKHVKTAIEKTTATMQQNHLSLLEQTKMATVDEITANFRRREEENLERLQKHAADELQELRAAKDSAIHALEREAGDLRALLASKESTVKELKASAAEIAEIVRELQSSSITKDGTIEVMRTSNTTKDDTIKKLRTSLSAKCDEVEKLQTLLVSKEKALEEEHATACKSLETAHSRAIAELGETHSMQMDTVWSQIRQLKKRDYVSSAVQTSVKHETELTLLSNVGLRRMTTGTAGVIPIDAEVISLESEGDQGDDEHSGTQQHDQSARIVSKRPLDVESQSRISKKSRELSPQRRLSSATEDPDQSLSVTSGDAIPRNADLSADATDKTFTLWKLFICAWDITATETQILLRQFDGLFSRGKDLEEIIPRIESHVVGSFVRAPAYPRCCLFADLQKRPHGTGGLALTTHCPYCKSDNNRICVWASYVPGVQSTYGDRVDGVIPVSGRNYNRDVTPWTAQFGAATVRWVLHRRRTELSHSVINNWIVGGVQLTFGVDPLAG